MRLGKLFLVCLMLILAPLSAARAQGWADQPFDASGMSREDVATLQAALAFSGDYFGFTDGVWNNDAQAALEAYVKREDGGGRPLFRHIEKPVMALEEERMKNGWQLFYSETTNTSYLHPFEMLKEVDNPDAVEFLSADEGFSMYVRFTDKPGMKDIHDWFMSKSLKSADPYQFADDNLSITSTTIEGDYIAYVRSDRNGSNWSTISIVLTPSYFPQLNLMAASMTVGGSPASLIWTKGGVIDQLINGGGGGAAPDPTPRIASNDPKDQVMRPMPPGVEASPPAAAPDPGPATVDVAGASPIDPTPKAPALGTPAPGGATPIPTPTPGGTPGPSPSVIGVGNPGPAPVMAPGTGAAPSLPALGTPAPEPEPPKAKVTGTLKSSGTGFYIAPTMLVTAAHVIEGCSAVAMIDGTPLDIMAADSSLDIAVLSGAADAGVWLKLSALEVPKLGEAVTALGYPYYTSLDQGLTVTSGNVSALRGADGSSNRVMITAPVQPGNSGGPLLNKKGAVIGVVVSRIDDLAVLEETGSLPQNMNFAVPSGPLLTFLAQNRISRPQGDGTGAEMSGEVPDGVAKAVIPLHCYQ